MKSYKTGFIGCGNMAAAIIGGILENNILKSEDVLVYDTQPEKCAHFTGVTKCRNINELCASADIVFLCVKPNIIPAVLQEIKVAGKCIVSIAAGVKVEKIRSLLAVPAKIMRIMPNTPLMVGKGAIGVQTPNDFNDDQRGFIYSIFQPLGLIKEVGPDDMDTVTGVSGSGPAYVYLFIDALAKAGEQNGLPAKTSLALALQTFDGACEMLKESDKPAAQLIEEVCSPGGTTIEAMQIFEQEDVRGIIARAVDACVSKSRQLSE